MGASVSRSINLNASLNGSIGGGWADIQNALENFSQRAGEIGETIDQLGARCRELEEEALEIYKNYETNMLQARTALMAGWTGGATEFEDMMKGLEQKASEWASSTIFHTDDVSAAINIAAQAGWDYEQIVKGVPAAMKLAQVGGLDLATALDYLVKTMYATGSSFDDTDSIVDMWTVSAKSSATNVGEMGEALEKLGAASRFSTGGNNELFTMLGVLANIGTTGTAAGTQLRQVMLRLAAPTDKAAKAMADLQVITEEEYNELISDEGFKEASQQLEQYGFSAYDAQGNLKPMLTIFKDLNKALGDMSPKVRNDVLSKMFPTRALSAAIALIDAAGEDFGGLEELILNSEGFADSAVEIMMGGLMGSMETLMSKWEEFERRIGETLAPHVEAIAGGLGAIIDWLNDLPEEQFTALVTGISTLAVMGPLLMGASGVASFFATLGPWSTAALLLSVGVGMLVGYLNTLKEMEFKDHFGTMQLDMDELGKHVDTLKTKFDEQIAGVAVWYDALEQAEQKYASTTTNLSELLLTDVLKGKKLEQADKEKIYRYAEDLYGAVVEGIENAKGRDLSFLQMLFEGDEDEDAINAYLSATGATSGYYDGLYAEAYQIGQTLREQMTAALADNMLDENERQAILATVQRWNQIQAEISNALSTEEYYAQLAAAERVSWDTISDFMTENGEKLETRQKEIDQYYDRQRGHYRAAFEYAKEHGLKWTDANGVEHETTDADWENFKQQLERERAEAHAAETEKFGSINNAAFDALMNDSEFADAYAFMRSAFANGGAGLIGELGGLTEEGFAFMNRMYEAGLLTYDMGDNLQELADNAGRLTAVLDETEGNQGTQNRKWGIENAEAFGALAFQYLRMRSQWEESGGEMYGEMFGNTGKKGEGVKVPYEPDQTKIDSWDPPVKQGTVEYSAEMEDEEGGGDGDRPWKPNGFATGGRTTIASIFGEDGPEWAIPEEHSANTAALLNAARAASGFSWQELISRSGGGLGGGQQIVINYAPVITANDAAGVESALARDRDRLRELIISTVREAQLRDDVRMYA